jgi:hypothetical protein
MTNRERENITLSFGNPVDRGSVEETFYPWTLTVERFKNEGLPDCISKGLIDSDNDSKGDDYEFEKYLGVNWGGGAFNYESYLGFDPVRRVSFELPFRVYEEATLEDTAEYSIKMNTGGRQIKHHKVSGLKEKSKHIVSSEEDWKRLKEYGEKKLEKFYTNENIKKAYLRLKEGHDRGDYPIRLSIEGFFWTPRELLGIEPHLYAFYDAPELIHDMNEYILKVYLDKLADVLEVLPADVVYIMEDLSGKNGPMISPELFDEFVGSYYKRLIPVLKKKGVKHVFVDTDGDFYKLIPNFIKTGVDGFLPMDVNAGMDIVKVRGEFPSLKFIGGFNKLCISSGKEAIDKEFERIMPVIRQGGYIPGCDHQVAPSASLENYKYYIQRLKHAMEQAGEDIS